MTVLYLPLDVNCGKVLDVLCLSAKNLFRLVGTRWKENASPTMRWIYLWNICVIRYATTFLSCWHCSPDNEDEGWYYWQHTEAGKDQLNILQLPNTNTGPAKYFCDAIKKTFSASKQLARVGFKQVPCCEVSFFLKHFNFKYLFWNLTKYSYSEMFYCSDPILRG